MDCDNKNRGAYMDYDNCFYFEGKANEQGLFDMSFLPWLESKRALNYTRHGRDKLEFSLSLHIWIHFLYKQAVLNLVF